MIKIFLPENKRKLNKVNLARGFWKNADNKIYYDYIRVIDYKDNLNNGKYELNIFLNYLEKIRVCNKQEAIFFNHNNKGYIFYGINKIEVLNHRIIEAVNYKELKQYIKAGLFAYNGITVYTINGKYFIEAFYNG